MKTFHIHLISDSTGETVITAARAALVQFEGVETIEHVWPMVRGLSQVDEVIVGIKTHPGFVLYTLVNAETRSILEKGCRRLQVPSIAILQPIVAALGLYLGAEVHARPGRQHIMDDDYFDRIEAMHFVLNHDDGQSTRDLNDADVVVVGVSRTSKTPTCIYLANRGIKAANIPVVPGCPLPPEILEAEHPLIVGLTEDPKRLVEIRLSRLRMLKQDQRTDYVDGERVAQEINAARRLFVSRGWPVIDVTRRSIEETAARILQLYNRRQEQTP